jgi:flagellin
MRELATQASTDTNTLTDRKEIQKEINQLLDEIDRIAEQTEFNTQKLLDGTYSSKVFHIGANADQKMDVTISDMGTSAIGTPTPATGSVVIDAGEGTVITITLTGPENDTYNGWTVKFIQADNEEDVKATVDADERTITVTWGSSKSPDIAAINAAIGDATAEEATLIGDITLSIDVDGEAQFDAANLNGQKISISGGPRINSLLVDDANIDALAADWTDQQVAEFLQDAGSGVGVLTQAGANAAISNINDAIEQVSAERSKLGAMQNRLEHTIANLGTSAENLQAAESRIRDLDMAEEIMAFTKNNILQQAATAMLAQANMAPQSVLQLLG